MTLSETSVVYPEEESDSNTGSDIENDDEIDEETIYPEPSIDPTFENGFNASLCPTPSLPRGFQANHLNVDHTIVPIPPEQIAYPSSELEALGRTVSFYPEYQRRSNLIRTNSVFVPNPNPAPEFVPKPRVDITKSLDDLIKLSNDSTVWNYNNISLFVPDNRYNSELSDRDYRNMDNIKWLTISNAKCSISKLYAKTKIHLTAKADVEFTDCEFYSNNFDSALDIFADSRAKFINCIFHDIVPQSETGNVNGNVNGDSCAIKVRDRSIVTFERCKFLTNYVSIMVESGNAIINNCEFESESYFDTSRNKYNILAAKNSTLNISNTIFRKFIGRNIFVHDNTKLYLSFVTANESQNGFLSCHEYSEACFDTVIVTNSEQSAMIFGKMCKIFMKNTIINYINGNGIHLDDTTGIITNSCIESTKYPCLYITGTFSNLIVNRCDFANSDMCGIVVKHCARPMFNYCRIMNCKEHGIKCMFYAMPELYHTCFANVTNVIYLEEKSIVYVCKPLVLDEIVTENECKQIFLNEIPYNLVMIDNNSILMSDIFDFDVNTYLSKVLFNNLETSNKDDVPVGNELNKYYKGHNEYYSRSMFANMKDVKPCTNVCEEELLKYISVSYLMKLDPIKCAEFDARKIDYMNSYNDLKSKLVPREDDFVMCIECGTRMNMRENENIFVINPCGHVVCERCKGIFERREHEHNHENRSDGRNISVRDCLIENDNENGKISCTKCMSKIISMNKLYYANECAICFENKPRTVLFPCNHVCCYGCATNCYLGNRKCPLCNQKLIGYGVLK